jgi:tRNA threonylcarbamoyladenosine biosynthesis protein TsaE
MKQHLPDAAATDAFAAELHSVLPTDTAGWTLLLEGELGAGKSTFARALIMAMGHSGSVPSPTYTLVEPYQLPDRIVYHVDLYRVSGEEELRYLGWTELEDGFRLVEWPERAPQLSKAADLIIRLNYADQGGGRRAEISALSPRGEDLISRLEAQSNNEHQD